MAIGIISALEAIEGNARPDDNSVVPPIDRLASLPQALIMQMAQKGQIPKTMVAPVLAKKAENAQLNMQMQAAMQRAQTGGVPPSTVVEKVIAQNAAQEAAPAMNRSNVGIASAPVKSDMFKAAGGGIVAFAPGGLYDQERFSPPASFSSSLAQQEGGMSRADALKLKEKYEAVMPVDRAFDYVDYRDAIRALDLPLPPSKTYSPSQPKDGSLTIEGSGMGAYDFDKDAPSGISSIFSDEGQAELDAYRKSLEARRPDRTSSTETDLDAAYEEVFGKKQPLAKEDIKADDAKEVVAPPEEAPPEEVKDKKDSSSVINQALNNMKKAREPKNEEEKELVDKASKLSGEELAMLGLEFGLNLLGTKEKDFLTAVGQSGKPALKTALARQAERRKEARESKAMEQKFKNQQALLKDELDAKREIAGFDRDSREELAKLRLEEVVARLGVSLRNADQRTITSLLVSSRDNQLVNMLEMQRLAAIKDGKTKEANELSKRIMTLEAENFRKTMETLKKFGVGGFGSEGGSESKGNDPAGIR